MKTERPTAESARERELVVAAQRGSTEAFAGLVRLHQRRAYAVARAVVLTHEDAEDAVQDGFLHAYKALDRFRPDQPFGAWLYRIISNAALDIVRRRRVRHAEQVPHSGPRPFRDPAAGGGLPGSPPLPPRQIARRGVGDARDRPAAEGWAGR